MYLLCYSNIIGWLIKLSHITYYVVAFHSWQIDNYTLVSCCVSIVVAYFHYTSLKRLLLPVLLSYVLLLKSYLLRLVSAYSRNLAVTCSWHVLVGLFNEIPDIHRELLAQCLGLSPVSPVVISSISYLCGIETLTQSLRWIQGKDHGKVKMTDVKLTTLPNECRLSTKVWLMASYI